MYYHEYHRPTLNYKVGEYVYLSGKNIKTLRPSEKLDYKKLDPFKALNSIESHAYKLKLPHSMKIYPVFYVNLLTPKELTYLPDITGRVVSPSPPIEVKGEEQYKVDFIKDSRKNHGQVQYLIKWKGYENPARDTWKPAENLTNCLDFRCILSYFDII